jgi:hypothetical protein
VIRMLAEPSMHARLAPIHPRDATAQAADAHQAFDPSAAEPVAARGDGSVGSRTSDQRQLNLPAALTHPFCY